MKLRDSIPLGEARTKLQGVLRNGEGTKCPCCGQMAKVYRRKINTQMAATMVKLCKASGSRRAFVHAPDLPGDTHECSQLVWWDLIQEGQNLRPDGGRAGWWRPTELGQDWVKGKVEVPLYAVVYDGVCLGLEGPLTSIQEALGTKFDLRELWNNT